MTEPACRLRAMRASDDSVHLVTRNFAFDAEGQLSLNAQVAHPSALDLLVGALATDLLTGLGRAAARAGFALDNVELSLNAWLDNSLVALGVVGENGSPALAKVTGSLYVSSAAPEPTLALLWQQALDRAPVYATLRRSVVIRIEIKPIP